MPQETTDCWTATLQHADLKPEEVGVICGFRQQVLTVRKSLRLMGLHAVNVGSVEDFQGQELRVIIISTVQTESLPQHNMGATSLGFIGHPKRFNVAITRAAELTIVVGKGTFLYDADPQWRALIETCVRHDTYSGTACEQLVADVSAEEGAIGAGTSLPPPPGLSSAGVNNKQNEEKDGGEFVTEEDEIILWKSEATWRDFL